MFIGALNIENEAVDLALQSMGDVRKLKIAGLKRKLASTDYKAIKFAEGWLTEEEYAPIRFERQAIRNKINALELEDEDKT